MVELPSLSHARNFVFDDAGLPPPIVDQEFPTALAAAEWVPTLNGGAGQGGPIGPDDRATLAAMLTAHLSVMRIEPAITLPATTISIVEEADYRWTISPSGSPNPVDYYTIRRISETELKFDPPGVSMRYRIGNAAAQALKLWTDLNILGFAHPDAANRTAEGLRAALRKFQSYARSPQVGAAQLA